MFDAITYYWSTQDPYGNPQSFDQIKEMGDKVHAAGKRWYAPLNPGYNSVLLKTGSCIPRKNGETLRTVWNGNLKSNPDGWGFISWNEIAENSHIKPMQKWGNTYVDILASLIGGNPQSPAPTPTPVGTGTYDDTHVNWSYSGNFAIFKGGGAYTGGIHYSTTMNDYAEFIFTGSQISLIYTENANRGKLDVYLDGSKIGTIDQYRETVAYQQRWMSGSLGLGRHKLKLVHAGPNGKVINIDAIEVNP
jgi:hypothetical protein